MNTREAYFKPDDTFYDCYHSNIKKILKYESGNHSLNKTKCNDWINAQKTVFRKLMALKFIESIEYVSYHDLFKLVEITITKMYKKINIDHPIYLYVGEPNKSFYFISLIALYYIKKLKLKEPTYYITQILKNKSTNTINVEQSNILIIDDMSYSGSQMNGFLKMLKKTNLKLIVGLIGINYLSFELLTANTNATIVYGKMFDLLIDKVGIEYYYYIVYLFSPFYHPSILLYFDHKIADNTSTFLNTLLYGPVIPQNYVFIDYFDNLTIKNPYYNNIDKFNILYDKFVSDNIFNSSNNNIINSMITFKQKQTLKTHIEHINLNIEMEDLKNNKYNVPTIPHYYNKYVYFYTTIRFNLLQNYLHQKILLIENQIENVYSMFSKSATEMEITNAYNKRQTEPDILTEFVPFINNCESLLLKNIEHIQQLSIPYGIFNCNIDESQLKIYFLFDLYNNIINNEAFDMLKYINQSYDIPEIEDIDYEEPKKYMIQLSKHINNSPIFKFIKHSLYNTRCPVSFYKKDFKLCKNLFESSLPKSQIRSYTKNKNSHFKNTKKAKSY